jgi:hypothetical protein
MNTTIKAIALTASLFITVLSFGKRPEKLIGFSLNHETQEVTITVVSSGCTQKTDFEFKWVENKLTIYRLKEDYCKAMEEAKTFQYKLQDVKIDISKSFSITNEFIASPFMAKISGK